MAASPDSLEKHVDPRSAAVLTVDMQRVYLDLEIASSPVLESEAERVLSSTRDALSFARGRGIPVVHAYSTRRPAEITGDMQFGGVRYLLDGTLMSRGMARVVTLEELKGKIAATDAEPATDAFG